MVSKRRIGKKGLRDGKLDSLVTEEDSSSQKEEWPACIHKLAIPVFFCYYYLFNNNNSFCRKTNLFLWFCNRSNFFF